MQQFVGGALYFRRNLHSAMLVEAVADRLDADLQRIASAHIPVLAIIGRDESARNGPKTATRFRRLLPAARIELVDDAGHNVVPDQPEIRPGLPPGRCAE